MRRRAHPPAGDEVLEFLRIIWEVNHHLQSASKRMSKTLGVTGPQRLALRMIGREPDMPTLRLATLLHLHPSTVTGILDRLERNGLVTRSPDPSDARSTRLGLTRRGRALDRVTEGTVEAAVGGVLGRMTAPTITAGRDVLTAICEALEVLEPPAHRAGRARATPRRGRRGARR